MKYTCLVLLLLILNCDNESDKNQSVKGRWGLVYKETHKPNTNYTNPQFFYNHEFDYYQSEIIEIRKDSIHISKALDPKGFTIEHYYYEKRKKSLFRHQNEGIIEIEYEFSSGELVLKEYFNPTDRRIYYLLRYEKFQGDYPSLTWTEGIQDDDFEPNNSKLEAKFIPFNASEVHSLKIGDVDYFKVGPIPDEYLRDDARSIPVYVFLESYEDINLTSYSGNNTNPSFANNYDERHLPIFQFPIPKDYPLLYVGEGDVIKVSGRYTDSTTGFYKISFVLEKSR